MSNISYHINWSELKHRKPHLLRIIQFSSPNSFHPQSIALYRHPYPSVAYIVHPSIVITYQTQIIRMEQPLAEEQPSNEGAYFNLQQSNPPENAANTDLVKSGLAAKARTGFIAKVYILLTIELLLTFGMCMLSQYCQAYRDFQLDYGWFMIFPVLFVMGCMLVAMFVPKAREFPFDNILLLVFVLSFGYIISFTCSVVVEDIPGPTVVIAMGATVGVVLVLTLYAFLCRANFVVYIGIILVVSVTMMMVGFVAIFTFADIMICIYCGLAVIIYGIYLVIITKLIIGGEFADFPMDNYIIASILLYIYVIKIFMMILRIVAISRRR